MTTYDYIMTMFKRLGTTVKVAELKAQLSAYLHAARAGQSVTVCDRETPVARLVPYAVADEPLGVRRPTRALRDVKLPRLRARKLNSLAALLDERQSSR